jgi:SnoaL-like domain
VGEARDVGERWFETATGGDPTAIEALLAPSCDFSAPGAALSNASGAARYVAAFAYAFPDAAFTIDRWIESGSTAVAEGRYAGNVSFFGQLGLMPGPGAR